MSEIKPAMTAEKWEWVVTWSTDPNRDTRPGRSEEFFDVPHAVAAQALYGESFGFTRADVEFLRDIEDAPFSGRWSQPAGNLADRIEALLPPEDTA